MSRYAHLKNSPAERIVSHARNTPPERFNELVYEGVIAEPHIALTELREVVKTFSNPDLRSVSADDAALCLERFQGTADTLHSLGQDLFQGHEEVRWLLGRALDRLGRPDQAIEHIAYACDISDTVELRPKAFARLAEINLSQYFNTRDHAYANPAYEAASMADHIERSLYTHSLFRKADEVLHESWNIQHGRINYPAGHG